MKHFKPNKTQQRMARIQTLLDQIVTIQGNPLGNILSIQKIKLHLQSALSFLSSRHHKRANNQLTIALALMKAL